MARLARSPGMPSTMAFRGFMAGCAAGAYRRHLYNKQQREGGPAPVGAHL